MKAHVRNALLSVAVLAILVAAVGWLVWRYENVVRLGTEVRFACSAYDPYDPLRGRYLRVTVRERCSDLDGRFTLEKNARRDLKDLYAKMEPWTNGLWRVVSVADRPRTDGGVWVKPKSVRIDGALGATVTLPDQLFVSERIAAEAENVLRAATASGGKGAVAVYRARDGEIVLTDIEVDGKSITSLARSAMRK